MEQSQQVLEWQAIAEKRGFAKGRQEGFEKGKADGKMESRAENIVRLLERRFNRKVPAALVKKIKAETELDQLDTWFDAAITSYSLEEFSELVRKQDN